MMSAETRTARDRNTLAVVNAYKYAVREHAYRPDQSVDVLDVRRVGGGWIFVMECRYQINGRELTDKPHEVVETRVAFLDAKGDVRWSMIADGKLS